MICNCDDHGVISESLYCHNDITALLVFLCGNYYKDHPTNYSGLYVASISGLT